MERAKGIEPFVKTKGLLQRSYAADDVQELYSYPPKPPTGEASVLVSCASAKI
jgi:hypothetical protein